MHVVFNTETNLLKIYINIMHNIINFKTFLLTLKKNFTFSGLIVLAIFLIFFFFHRLGWFPIQGLRPTCYCISGPRRIPAVGVTRHTPFFC